MGSIAENTCRNSDDRLICRISVSTSTGARGVTCCLRAERSKKQKVGMKGAHRSREGIDIALSQSIDFNRSRHGNSEDGEDEGGE